ncbi:MAG: hypothetical protein A2868_02450 [Candidatus Levybacteria bacterium RIFCSPHIGHO2_01_FULL_40_15b]|nr:MAG: hypothetical protein A2868_02450 [Candidatus Levybacteria bacterium RIFCSPHIGHO2_01_FULL_40_15b]
MLIDKIFLTGILIYVKGKQGLIIAVIIIAILAALGYFYFGKSASLPGAKSTVFTSIQDALSKSLSLKCEYTDTNGIKATAYIKNGAVRADTTSPNVNESGSVIMKDKKMYFWNAQGGFMMEIPDVTPEPGSSAPKEASQAENIMKDLDQYKESCKPAVVSDSLFTPPSDVKFTDFSNMFQVPTGAQQQAQPTVDQKQIEELMKQYSQPPDSSGE